MGYNYHIRGDCMKGSIYTDQRCPVCGGKLKSREPKGFYCPSHPRRTIDAPCRVVFDNRTTRAPNYEAGYKILMRKRGEVDEGTYDVRDYMLKDKPLAFDRLAEEWLKIKRPNMKPGGWLSIRAIMAHPVKEWGGANIKSITYARMEDFFAGLELASKTKHNILTTLKQFWAWAAKRYKIPRYDDWPDIGRVRMARRKTIDQATRRALLEDIKDNEPYRVWLCIRWLCVYGKVRPSEMLSVNEGDIDRNTGLVTVRDTKEGEPKTFPLTEADLALVRRLPIAFDKAQAFFAHDGHRGHTKRGQRYSRQLLWEVWKRACKRLGVEGVDLYGGTRHSLLTAMRQTRSYDEVKTMSGHTTNKSLDRYIVTETAMEKSLYELAEKTLLEAPDPDKILTRSPSRVQCG